MKHMVARERESAMATATLQHKPPKDMMSLALQITDGCTHGKCRFCDIYEGVPFTALPREEVIADIEELAKRAMSHERRVYFTGGNPYALPTDQLLEIMDEIEKRIPSVNSYGGFCRIMDIARKSDEELAALAARGVNDIAIGAESGYDPALEFMEKGCTAADIVEQGRRLHDAGIEFTFFYLAGLAGAGKGQENAIASAKAFSAAVPKTILIVTITPTKTWRLHQDVLEGRWEPEGEREMAEEIRTFIAHLDCTCHINCSHDSDIIQFEGMVPKDQENMLKLLDARIPKMNEASARKRRQYMHGACF